MRSAAFLLLFIFAAASTSSGKESIHWRSWSDAAFADAQREHKFVLLDLQATWCHWCHVMDQETYSDPKVISLINARYIAVQVNQDARPDLSNRYEDYGWPATVVFAVDGSEIVKRQGYIPPRPMASMLQAIIDDPSPGPSVRNEAESLGPSSTDALRSKLIDAFDTKLGGWGDGHKYLDWDNVEYLVTRGAADDARSAAMAKQTLAGAMKLIDPVWGGADQYSIDDWDHPHFEKLIQMQAHDMRIYAMAYAAFRDPAYLAAAKKIHEYVAAFLTSPQGPVYVSQNADIVDGQAPEPYYQLDDAGRRRQGIPRVDRNVYARENGWWIEALCQLYASTGDARYREEAIRTASWIVAHRAVPGGGFSHGDRPDVQLYLGDTLFMGRAFLSLAEVTGDRAWFDKSEQAAAFIRANFGSKAQGFSTATKSEGIDRPQPEYDENAALTRWANLLAHESGNKGDQAMAASSLAYTREESASRFAYVGGYLLAQAEAQAAPLHVVVIGARGSAEALSLFTTALAAPAYYKQIEWFDPADAAHPPPALYPRLPKPAAFLCVNQACSTPVYTVPDLARLIAKRLP